MRPFEKVLVDLDSGTRSALARIALGVVIVPVFRALPGQNDSAWVFAAMFLALLMAVRGVPAVLRHTLPFSAEAKAIWAERRAIAKQFDSYQWQKLFWIGVGLALYGAAAGGLKQGELIVTMICLLGGGAGLLMWHQAKTHWRCSKA